MENPKGIAKCNTKKHFDHNFIKLMETVYGDKENPRGGVKMQANC
jgi:hypothetical protein